jgi:hypothetical protein
MAAKKAEQGEDRLSLVAVVLPLPLVFTWSFVW